MEEMICIEMNKNNAVNMKSLLQEKIWSINKQIEKYSNIIANYLTNVNYEYVGCTLNQAMNCGESLGEEFQKYCSILDDINKYVS